MHASAMVNVLSFFCWRRTHHTAAHHSYHCSRVTCLLHSLRSCTHKCEREEEVLRLAEGAFPMLGGVPSAARRLLAGALQGKGGRETVGEGEGTGHCVLPIDPDPRTKRIRIESYAAVSRGTDMASHPYTLNSSKCSYSRTMCAPSIHAPRIAQLLVGSGDTKI